MSTHEPRRRIKKRKTSGQRICQRGDTGIGTIDYSDTSLYSDKSLGGVMSSANQSQCKHNGVMSNYQ